MKFLIYKIIKKIIQTGFANNNFSIGYLQEKLSLGCKETAELSYKLDKEKNIN